jgi:hypothetical protein
MNRFSRLSSSLAGFVSGAVDFRDPVRVVREKLLV